MKKRSVILICVALGGLLLLSTVLTVVYALRADALEKHLDGVLSRSGYALSEQLNTTSLHLAQLTVLNGCDSRMEEELREKTELSASLAADALSGLPLSSEILQRVLTFLNRVADYCRNAGSLDSAAELYRTCTLLCTEVDNYLLTSPSLSRTLFEGEEAAAAERVPMFTLPDSAIPRLIYDGPFSESTVRPDPPMLSALPESDEARARAVWDELLPDEKLLSVQSVTEGILPYYFMQGERATAGLTRRGALPWWFHRLSDGEEIRLSEEECLSRAAEALTRTGFADMRCVYTQRSDTGYTFNFARDLDGITVYAELIKVGISHFNGDVLLWEAGAYLTSHTERSAEAPTLTQEQACAALPAGAQEVTAHGLALVPSEKWGEPDRLCYEFTLTREGLRCYCFVNAADGSIFDLLIIRPDGVAGGEG